MCSSPVFPFGGIPPSGGDKTASRLVTLDDAGWPEFSGAAHPPSRRATTTHDCGMRVGYDDLTCAPHTGGTFPLRCTVRGRGPALNAVSACRLEVILCPSPEFCGVGPRRDGQVKVSCRNASPACGLSVIKTVVRKLVPLRPCPCLRSGGPLSIPCHTATELAHRRQRREAL